MKQEKAGSQGVESTATRTETLERRIEEGRQAEFDRIKRKGKLRNDNETIEQRGEEHQHDFQPRGISQMQGALQAPISTDRDSSPSSPTKHAISLPVFPKEQLPPTKTHFSMGYENEVAEIKLKNKARKRAELAKEMERLGLTGQNTLPLQQIKSYPTSPLSISKMERPAPPREEIARKAQEPIRKLRKKPPFPSASSPKPLSLLTTSPKNELLSSPRDKRKKTDLASKAKTALQKLKDTLSPPSRPSTPAPHRSNLPPCIIDTKKKIEFAREAQRELEAEEILPGSSRLRIPTDPASLSKEELRVIDIDMIFETERKVELGREVRQRIEVEKTRGVLLASGSESLVLDCIHGLRYGLCRICGES
jgi:hypothetical protein